MLRSEVLKEILKLKLRIADSIIEKLPDDVSGKVSSFQRELIKVVGETAEEYIRNADTYKDNKVSNEVKNIDIM